VVFVLTKIDDIRDAARQADLFSSGHGLFLNDLRMQKDNIAEKTVFDGFFPSDAEHFAFADPPRHKTLRGLITPAFSVRNIKDMTPLIEEFVTELIAKIQPGVAIDFVAEIADQLPIMISTRLLGIAVQDIEMVKKWSDALEDMNSVDSLKEIEAAKATFAGMNAVFEEEFARQRITPGNGLVADDIAGGNLALDLECGGMAGHGKLLGGSRIRKLDIFQNRRHLGTVNRMTGIM